MDANQLTQMAIPGATRALESHATQKLPQDSGQAIRAFPVATERFRQILGLKLHDAGWVRMANWVENYVRDLWLHGRSNWLSITGKTGTGKSHCARNIHWWARQIQQERLGQRRWGNAPEFCRWGEFIKDYVDSSRGRLRDLKWASHLVLDELGVEHKALRESAAPVLHEILSYREERDLPTVITCNMSVRELATVYDSRIASRLLRNDGRELAVEHKPHWHYKRSV